jgi:NTE family protein
MRLGVALGSGAARGLAHIPYIEAIDELGLTPSIVAGTSIGALIGSGWANGMTGAQLRAHAYDTLGSVQQIAGKLWNTTLGKLSETFAAGISLQADARLITDAFLPVDFPSEFSALKVPFRAVATDFHAWEPVVFSAGPLRPAIAASLAIPSLFRPVTFDGRLYVDGGVTNPLPLDQAAGECDLLVAIDVNGWPDARLARAEPSFVDIGLVATQIMAQKLEDAMIRRYPPDLYVRPQVGLFGAHEFWRVREIIAEAEKDKERFKQALSAQVETRLSGQGVPLVEVRP